MNVPAKHGRRYPWASWFSLKSFSLIRGEDYDCLPHGMAQMVRNVAARRGLRVSVSLGEEGLIEVQVKGKLNA